MITLDEVLARWPNAEMVLRFLEAASRSFAHESASLQHDEVNVGSFRLDNLRDHLDECVRAMRALPPGALPHFRARIFPVSDASFLTRRRRSTRARFGVQFVDVAASTTPVVASVVPVPTRTHSPLAPGLDEAVPAGLHDELVALGWSQKTTAKERRATANRWFPR